MLTPAVPADEASRLQRMHALGHLYAPTTRAEDALVRLARERFGVKFAVHSLMTDQEQWYKAADGLDAISCPRDLTFCAHALEAELMVVEDATLDPRFRDNPAVTDEPYVRFYAGYPLRNGPGSAVGTFCVIDTEPRRFSEADRRAFERIGHMAEGLLRHRDPKVDVARKLLGLTRAEDLQQHVDPVTGTWSVSAMRPLLQEQLANMEAAGGRLVLLMLAVDLSAVARGDASLMRMVRREFARVLRSNATMASHLFHNGAGRFIAACEFPRNVSTEQTPGLLRAQVEHNPGWDLLGIEPPRFDTTCNEESGDLIEQAEAFMQEAETTGTGPDPLPARSG